ncbi:MAG: hypothetical protein M3328_05680, partial [Chloroflexota bacterium]|nr:hypothetical protein [Chloroflexota bacterium]
MNARAKGWILPLVIMLGLALSGAQGAAAGNVPAPLPPTKQPSSARFDISGTLSLKGLGGDAAQIGDVNIQIAGTGAMSGDNLQEEITVKLPDSLTSEGTPGEFKASIVLLDRKYYFKTTGLSPGSEDKWYVMDLSNLPAGSQPPNAGMAGSPLGAIDPRLEAAFKVTQAGKETIGGAPTTQYRVDVDIRKLIELADTGNSAPPDPDTEKILANTKFALYMWVGDNNMYLYQARLTLDSKLATENAP